jgi:hypothetical protein
MTDATKQADEIAALRRELDELKAKVSPPKSTFKEMTDAEHRDWVHQMQERRMSMAMPPSVIRDLTVLDDATVRGIVNDNRNAPTGPTGAIPRSHQPSNPDAGSGTGWVDPRPLGPPPGIRYVDAQIDAQDAKDRAVLVQQAASAEAARKFAEQSEKLNRLIEQTNKELKR